MLKKARTAKARAAAVMLLVAGVLGGCSGAGGGTGSGSGSGAGGAASGGATADSKAADNGSPAPVSTEALPASFTAQQVAWGGCSAPEGGSAPGSGWQCATVQVPLDYTKPGGEKIGIALIRKAATGTADRIGSLLFNFGGPGGSGVATLPSFGSSFSTLNSRYDLVGFDPRGVAASEGVRCRTDDETETASSTIDLTPDTSAEEQAYFSDSAAFAAGCEKNSGSILPYVSTANAARDMDLIRQVLGDSKLNYFGFSYGTELGGTYAHLFPGKVGRAVLDAVVDPTADSIGHARNQATGFQRALDNYLKSTGQDPAEGTAKIAALLKRLDKEPLPASGGRKLTESLAITGIVLPLYNEANWPYLTQGLDQAESGRGDVLLSLADSYNDRDTDGHYGTASHSQRAISCVDSSQRPTAAEAKALLPEFEKLSPVFGPFLAWDAAGWCTGWPVPGEQVHPEVSAAGAPPILVVGTTGDPATPYEGARKMADALGAGVGVELTFEGEGHGAYTGGNTCVTSTVNGFLLDGTVPADGKTCS